MSRMTVMMRRRRRSFSILALAASLTILNVALELPNRASAADRETPEALPPLHPDAESARPLSIGQRVPHATVRDVDGMPVDMASLTADSGALLVFYRGGW